MKQPTVAVKPVRRTNIIDEMMKRDPDKVRAEIKEKEDFEKKLEDEFQALSNLGAYGKNDIDKALENAFSGSSDWDDDFEMVKDEITGKYV
jgi:Holliday junction resolvasome RuvABC DNA-binding subunit